MKLVAVEELEKLLVIIRIIICIKNSAVIITRTTKKHLIKLISTI